MILNVQVEEKKGTQLVHIEGRLDAANAPKLELKLNKLVKEGSDQIVLDFAKVDYLSSAGIRLLLSMTKRPGSTLPVMYADTDENMSSFFKRF